MTKEKYSVAFSELYFLISKMHKTNRNKIAKEFIDFLERNKDNNYSPKGISFENKESLKRETKILIAIMHRDYFLNESERNKIEIEEKEILDKMYSYDNLFKTNDSKKELNSSLEVEEISFDNIITDLIEVDEKSWFNKIKIKIKNFFEKFKSKGE